MKVENLSNEEPSPEEIKQLEELKRIVEAAVSDGRLSQSEMEHIKNFALAHKKLIREELQLYRTLVLDKIERGELEYQW